MLSLHRMFPFGAGEGRAAGVSLDQHATTPERAETALLHATTPQQAEAVLLQAQIDTLRQIVELLDNELAYVKKDRDAWRSQANRLRQFVG